MRFAECPVLLPLTGHRVWPDWKQIEKILSLRRSPQGQNSACMLRIPENKDEMHKLRNTNMYEMTIFHNEIAFVILR